uniref:Uncharacterized protein AlNc14C64G4579 n=1 Tax=Albugo laibachii Nc14 TaxID=890382 RepID=F0WD59_9STRA|nr:conserved hypothetical protein [Albugo laibachii Nc14]|eukprot:CCA19131.1 conserved hypothetical protein [Albugo laibachii Nc14]
MLTRNFYNISTAFVYDCDHTLLIMSTCMAKNSLQFILSDESGNFNDSSSDSYHSYQSKLVSAESQGNGLESVYESNTSSMQPKSPADVAPSELTDSSSDNAKQSKKSSKFCMVEDCMKRAKHSRRCWKHGGSIPCKMPNCINRAKAKGLCWSHGGGRPCRIASCGTIAVSNGVCWAHGGGKRCLVPDCGRPASRRTPHLCRKCI